MCEIYTDQCAVCEAPIEMHLEDFKTAPSEVIVYCAKHVDHADVRFDRTLWIWTEPGQPEDRAVVVALTENAAQHWRGNLPNEGERMRFVHYAEGAEPIEGVDR
ncbi:MAG: hypothetical protein WC700_19025 [Gemmatimonadaceae bacterium]|jgi:hypothetical protein